MSSLKLSNTGVLSEFNFISINFSASFVDKYSIIYLTFKAIFNGAPSYMISIFSLVVAKSFFPSISKEFSKKLNIAISFLSVLSLTKTEILLKILMKL